MASKAELIDTGSEYQLQTIDGNMVKIQGYPIRKCVIDAIKEMCDAANKANGTGATAQGRGA